MGSSEANVKCLLITHEMRCDAHTADSAYRTNDDCRHCGDSFFVSVDNPWGYVCARRTDSHGGWGLKLRFNCNSIQDNIRTRRDVHIGSSHHNTKCVWGGATSFVPPTPQIQATVATATHSVTGSRSQQTMEMFVPDGLIIMEDGALTCRFLAFFMADAD